MKIDGTLFQGTEEEMFAVQNGICKAWAEIVLENFQKGIETQTLERTDGKPLSPEELEQFEYQKAWRLGTMLCQAGEYIAAMGLTHVRLMLEEKEYEEFESKMLEHLGDTVNAMFEAAEENIAASQEEESKQDQSS